MSALNSQPGADYGTAKQQFLEALRSAPLPGSVEGLLHRSDVGRVAEELRTQVDSVITAEALEGALSQQQEAAAEAEQGQQSLKQRRKGQEQQRSRHSSKKDAAAGARGQRGSGALPALQELSGKWCGCIEVFGVPAGATNIDFSLRGEDWRCAREVVFVEAPSFFTKAGSKQAGMTERAFIARK
ncbi:hypothetical protein DUNSADRAFT_8009 [Dunaliella salina]|uniref:Uncharacterized protein n=1 Tax=Dunaliella salina TaxID=3046 RepID=A0ABQ7FT05_DUNSA|nr:hypothetical protein DUNSADRAFT_8009 [Dunaliella salina]|eukprot:KAF5825629.1 hypothetical protein DUNSADRAFT_8009 [Dunaliella salina]